MMRLPGGSRGRKLLRDDATEHLQRSLTILRAEDFPEAMQSYPQTGDRSRRKKARFWLSRMLFLLECGDGLRTNQRASTKQRQTIPANRARGQHDSVGGSYVWSFWGNQKELDKLLQAYAVEVCRQEARKKGYQVSETQLQDGSIRLQIVEGG
jgi:hypothetical protein